MGCFLACFGLSNKRKRRNTLYKVLAAGNQKYGNYEALAITEKSIVPYSDFRKRDESKEQNSVISKKKKKKVTFNLKVQIYEPNPTAYQELDNEEEENENITSESEGKNSSSSILGEGSASLKMRYPQNYRYYNCSEDYEEEDDIAYEESDIDEYDDDEFDDGYDCDDGGSDESLDNDEVEVYDQNIRQKDLLSDPCYSSVAEEKIRNQMQLAPNDTEMKSNSSGQDRSINMHSVLKPVENLTQWKAIKAKVATSSKIRRKENVNVLNVNVPSSSSEKKTSMPLVSEASLNFSPCCSLESNVLQSKPLLPEIAVDASLSNWLSSPNYSVSKTTIHCQ